MCVDGSEYNALFNEGITIIFPLKLCHLIIILWSNIPSTCFIYNQLDNEYRELIMIVIRNRFEGDTRTTGHTVAN